MIKLNISLLLMTVAICVQCSEGDENICYTEESYVELEEEKTTQPVKIRSYNWCLSFPPRCSNYRTENREVLKLQNVTKTKLVEHCCEGYNDINLNNGTSSLCLPFCRGGCGQGICESPNICKCNIGFEGQHCTQRCRPRTYGRNCKNICKCRNRSLCDHKTGFCRCAVGWIGEFCELPCPKGRYGMMCYRQCQCNNHNCDPQSGECLSENVKILFDLSGNRSSNIMKLSSNRIKAKHWIPVNGNGKINMRNCSNPDRCESNTINGNKMNESTPAEYTEDNNNTALIHELNSNLSNLTKELKKASEKPIAIVVKPSIAVHHHIHDAEADSNRQAFNDLLSSSITEINSTETQQIIYDQLNEFDGTILQSIDHNDEQDVEDYEEIDSIGGYNDVIHVLRIVNTTKSEQIVTLPEILPHMVPVTLILLIILCVAFITVFGVIYLIRRSKESHAQRHPTTHEDITLSDQIVQKSLPEIPSFTQSISRRIMQHDFYDRPLNNKSVKSGLDKLGYCYAENENENNRQLDEKLAIDEHIYDEIKYSNYNNCETRDATTQR